MLKIWIFNTLCFIGTVMSAKEVANLKPEIQVDLGELGPYVQPAHTHQSVLDADGIFSVYWTPDLVKQEVIWELHVRTLGWFGFGFSSKGNMRGSDIMTAWVTDGRLFLQDRHGVGDTLPPLDNHADWRPLHASENDTHTIVVVARDINTCDPQDFLLTNETIRLIYAWSETDPTDGANPNYHGQKRGNRFALVLLPFHRPPVSPDVQTWSVRQKKTVPPGQDTFYWCHIEKIPKWKKKHHYVGFDMIYVQNSRSHLHHAVAFECKTKDGSPDKEIYDKYVGHPGYECYTPNMPPDFFLCEKFLINWAVGSEGELLPERVGIPLGSLHGGSDYLLFQVHYDNKPKLRNLTVEWGMDIFYTDKLREQEAGNMAVGHSIVFSLTVPPRTPHWLVSGHCPAACTSEGIPEGGINVFMVFLHAHYLARAIRLRHFREGKELKPMAVDSYFDADFQQSRTLSEEVKMLPGDHLTVECDYESMDRPNGTYSGWAANDEMCQAFIHYYPRVDLALCRSSPMPEVMKKAYGIKSFPEDMDLYDYIFDPEIGDGRKYQEFMNTYPWNRANKTALNEATVYGDHHIKCQYNYGVKMKINATSTRYPIAEPYKPPDDKTCSLKRRPGAMGQDLSYTVVSSHSHSSGSHKDHEDGANGGLTLVPTALVALCIWLIASLK